MACFFCQRNIQSLSFKETDLLSRFTSGMGKIKPTRKTGVCATHQRKLAQAIKRARYMALLP